MIKSLKNYIKNNILRRIWNNIGYFNYFNQKVYFPRNSVIFNRAVSEHIYEKENINLIKRFVKQNSSMMDIGANIGIMAIPILAMNKNIDIISIEPSPNTFPYLQKTYEISKYKNNWTLINEAVSTHIGEISFQLTNPANGAYESILDTKRTHIFNTIKVKCNTIDSIWEKRNKPNISFIKTDIEGADLLALRGGIKCINDCKPIILMEWNNINIIPYELTNKNLIEFANQINYSIYNLPYFSKCLTTTDIYVSANFNENFLLVSNE